MKGAEPGSRRSYYMNDVTWGREERGRAFCKWTQGCGCTHYEAFTSGWGRGIMRGLRKGKKWFGIVTCEQNSELIKEV